MWTILFLIFKRKEYWLSIQHGQIWIRKVNEKESFGALNLFMDSSAENIFLNEKTPKSI